MKEKFIVNVEFPYFKVEVNASDPRDAVFKAAKIMKKFQNKKIDFDGFVDLSTDGFRMGYSTKPTIVQVVNPTDQPA
jgi:hypothetical protein